MLSSARCAGCANAHEGSENVIRSRCEACLTKAPCYGLLEEGKKQRVAVEELKSCRVALPMHHLTSCRRIQHAHRPASSCLLSWLPT